MKFATLTLVLAGLMAVAGCAPVPARAAGQRCDTSHVNAGLGADSIRDARGNGLVSTRDRAGHDSSRSTRRHSAGSSGFNGCGGDCAGDDGGDANGDGNAKSRGNALGGGNANLAATAAAPLLQAATDRRLGPSLCPPSRPALHASRPGGRFRHRLPCRLFITVPLVEQGGRRSPILRV